MTAPEELPAGVACDEESGQLFRLDLLDHAREIMAVCRKSVEEYASQEEVGDVIADMLHLAAASGLDVDEVLDYARRCYTGDLEGALA